MTVSQEQKGSFVCKHCSAVAPEEAPGTHNRNHCPFCLYSRHVDITRGDRRSRCGGMMKPIGVVKRDDGEELLIHQCQGCGFVGKNRLAGDDDEQEVAKVREMKVGERLL